MFVSKKVQINLQASWRFHTESKVNFHLDRLKPVAKQEAFQMGLQQGLVA